VALAAQHARWVKVAVANVALVIFAIMSIVVKPAMAVKVAMLGVLLALNVRIAKVIPAKSRAK
jgi:hypothetical protein